MISPLKQSRLERNLSRSDAGALVGCAGESFRRYENGEQIPGREIMAKICAEFGVQPNDFYDFNPLPVELAKEARAP